MKFFTVTVIVCLYPAVFCSVLLNRLKSEVDNILREEQAGNGQSFSEQILTFRNIVDKSLRWQVPLFINYVDFDKAFYIHVLLSFAC